MNYKIVARLIGAVLLGSLAACGGTGGVSIGGAVSGLTSGSSVVLQNNGSSTLTVSANGAFAFNDGTSAGQSYNVTVLTQPTAQTCTVTNGSGSVDSNGDDVTGISVVCAVSSSLGGTVTGLAAGTAVTLTETLSTNVVANLAVAANGAFAFNGILPANTGFAVTVATQPSGQTCTVANATGTITANVMSLVTVTCTTP
jgi:hypothetical protein